MPVKISKNRKKFIAFSLSEKAKPVFFKAAKKIFKEEIIDSIEAGKSPVEKGGIDPKGTSGKLRFEKYSDSYTKQIKRGYHGSKRERPVNMKLTGKMLKSLKFRVNRESITIWFSSPIAKYHNKLGAGKKKVIRRLLPTKNEQFNAGIRKRLVNALRDAFKFVKNK